MFWGAGHYTVFDDEAFSCRRYVMPMGEMVSALWHGAEPDPPLYYVLENGWVRIFGTGPLGLRSLSILFFVVGLVFIRAAGQAWFGASTGRAAMILCALHPAHLFFGFAARWYSLMFLLVAVLLWQTARLSEQPQRRGRVLGWALTAAGVCYTNYFGPVVVILAWIVGTLRARTRPAGYAPWVGGGLIALALYTPWLIPFSKQVLHFQGAGDSWAACGSTAARTAMALAAGNLASVGAWWVWAPMGAFGIAMTVLLLARWRDVWPVGVIAMGCLCAGVASRTMIDKYVMTFSGAMCLLAAALIVRGWQASPVRAAGAAARAATAGLIIGWAGCAVNLVTEQHWSSLRWLDPFGQALEELASDEHAPPPTQWVMTHPAARYYYQRHVAAREIPERGGDPAATPESILTRMKTAPVASLATVQTAGFARLPDWQALQAELSRAYRLVDERRYLEDPDAAWKDRLDPNVRHPRWRIVVKRWERRAP